MKAKFIIFILFYTILNSFSFAQQKCTDLENEIKIQKAKNEELSKENRYYKETLDLLKPIQSVKIDGLQLDITSIVGSKADKTVTVTFMYKNIEAEKRSFFQCAAALQRLLGAGDDVVLRLARKHVEERGIPRHAHD